MTEHAINCPVCSTCGVYPLFGAGDADTGREQFSLVRCRQCDLVRLDPMPTPSMLEAYYDRQYYGGGKRKFLPLVETLVQALNGLRARKILRWLNRFRPVEELRPRVLDIGCGRGGLLDAFARRGCECDGLERSGYESGSSTRNHTLYLGELDTVDLEKDSYDLVVIWHVLEHLPDPAATLDRVFKLLRSNGMLVLSVPNMSSRQARWFRQRWFHLDLPRHIWHFTPENLNRLCQSYGFHRLRSHGLCFEQNVYGFMQSALNSLFKGKQNRLFHLLQGGPRGDLSESILWGLSSIVLVPVALIEYLFSASDRHGATTVQFWVKP